MTTLLLIRHGLTDAVGHVLAGWSPVPLNAAGLAQAEELALRLEGSALRAIYTSPIARCLETAGAIAVKHTLVPEPNHDLGEIRFGDWTGHTFESLARDPEWQSWNHVRSRARAPAGESFLELQSRVVHALEALCVRHTHDTIAVVSHGDPIKAALMYWLAIPIDFVLRFEIDPASVTTVLVEREQVRVVRVNGNEPAH